MKNKFSKKILAAAGLSASAILGTVSMIIPWEGSVKNKEGYHQVYKDVVGIPTACYGQTGRDLYGKQIRMGDTYTEQECLIMLGNTVKKFEQAVDRHVKTPYASPYQKAAFISFTYNVGEGAFAKSTLLRKKNAGDDVGACEELSRWKYAGGKVVKGLENRRENERKWCLGQVPSEVGTTYESIVNFVKDNYSTEEF